MCSFSNDTIRIRWTMLTCAQKLTSSQLNLPHGTKQKIRYSFLKKRVTKKQKKNKNRDAQKKWSCHKVRGVSPEAERESTVGKICERCIGLDSWARNEIHDWLIDWLIDSYLAKLRDKIEWPLFPDAVYCQSCQWFLLVAVHCYKGKWKWTISEVEPPHTPPSHALPYLGSYAVCCDMFVFTSVSPLAVLYEDSTYHAPRRWKSVVARKTRTHQEMR